MGAEQLLEGRRGCYVPVLRYEARRCVNDCAHLDPSGSVSSLWTTVCCWCQPAGSQNETWRHFSVACGIRHALLVLSNQLLPPVATHRPG